MSAPVVVIGFIILVPTFVGLAFTLFVLSSSTTSSLTDGVAILFGISCFVGGIFGWLLIMKKRVLRCSICGAIVNAS